MLQRLALYLMLTTAVLSMAQVPAKSDKSDQPKNPSPAAAGKQLPKRIVTNLSGFDLLPKDRAQKHIPQHMNGQYIWWEHSLLVEARVNRALAKSDGGCFVQFVHPNPVVD